MMTTRETPDIETASDDYASRFSGAAGEYFLQVQTATVAKVLSRKYGTVLELGGGHGQLLELLTESTDELIEYGSDNSCHAMQRHRHPGIGTQNVTGDMLKLPFADKSVEVVIYVRLISHIEDWPLLLAESCRVSKQAVIFDYPSVMSANALTPILFKLKKGVEKNTRDYISFSRRQLKAELAKHGYKISAHKSQFILPMFIHRGLKGAEFLQLIEKFFAVTGLTSLFGSPVILRAERIS